MNEYSLVPSIIDDPFQSLAMYVPPDEPVHAMGEVNMNFQVEEALRQPRTDLNEQDENELNLANINPIYQRLATGVACL